VDIPSPGGRSILAHRKQDKPIEAVELTIEFRADKDTSEAIRSAMPFAKVKGSTCVLRIDGTNPGEVAEKAKEILEVIRGLAEPSKGFN